MPAKKAAPALRRRRPLGQRLCRLAVSLFAAVYLAALALLGLSLLDLFGFAPKPLAGAFLIVLGLPWTLMAAWFPDDLQPWVAAAAPTINWLILGFFCAWRRLKAKRQDSAAAP